LGHLLKDATLSNQTLGRKIMSPEVGETTNWPDLFVGLYDRLTGRHAEITYSFDNLEIDVPSGTSESSGRAHWKLNGVLRITTRDTGQ
jgi:hypothetical protein